MPICSDGGLRICWAGRSRRSSLIRARPLSCSDGRPEMGELCQIAPGNALPLVVNRIPVRDAQGRLIGMVSQAIFNDPEELKKLSAKIDHLGHKLNQYKRRFKASLSPQYTLASILG